MAGAILSTASRSLFNPDAFGQRVAASLSEPGVAAFIADRLTDSVVKRRPDMVAVRPLILATSSALVTSRPFQALVAVTASRTHEALLSETSRNVVLSLPDVEVLVQAAIRQASPELAARIPPDLELMLTSVGEGPASRWMLTIWRTSRHVPWEASTALIAAPIFLAFAIWVAPYHRRGMLHAGVALIAAGLAVAALLPVGAVTASAFVDDPLMLGAVEGLWRTFMAGLRSWGVFIAGLGVLMAAGGTSLLEAVDPVVRARYVSRLLVLPPEGRARRTLWGFALLAAGLLISAFPEQTLAAIAILGGVFVAYVGTRELFRLLLESVAATPVVQKAPDRWAWAFRGVVLAVLIGGLAYAWISWRYPSAEAISPTFSACNGYQELCGRRVDEVVFPGSHNAMSNQEIADWMFPHHQRNIPRQLREGVRALLIDVHYGFPGGSRIETDLSGGMGDKIAQAVGPEGVAAAERIRDRLTGVNRDERRLFLCHGFCELGAYELTPLLREVREFLLHNPDEVLLIIVEDYITPQDLEASFTESKLASFVYDGPSGPLWPTLGELITGGRRVIVFIESGRPGVTWLRPALETFQETPYTFHKPDEFSCRPNRGGTDGSLFLMNHWIETTPAPRPSNAAVVNSYEFLLQRAERCTDERGQKPNIVAVDFSGIGDLLAVVNHLNGIDAAVN